MVYIQSPPGVTWLGTYVASHPTLQGLLAEPTWSDFKHVSNQGGALQGLYAEPTWSDLK